MSYSMKVLKRDGSYEPISFDKVLGRIRKASKNLHVNPDSLSQQVLARIYDGVKTCEIDELTGQLAASLSTTHPDYGTLAARIAVSNHQKNTDPSFTNVILSLSQQTNKKTKEAISYISEELVNIVKVSGKEIDSKIDHDRDYLFDYFGFKTLEKSYLLKDANQKILERPQHLWMRTSLALWPTDLKRAFETYDYMSQKYFTHATPTLFNAGTLKQQLSSCFIAGTKVHTMDGVKNIENVCIDDEVITHTGSIKKVKQLHTNLLGDRELYTIKIAGTPSMTVTGNHRIWSLSNEQENWGKAPSWNSIDYLRTGDWIAIPNKKFTNSDYILDVKTYLDNIIGDGYNIEYSYEYTDTQVIPSYKYISHHQTGPRYHTKLGNAFNRYWTFDKTMMELLGIWYGDGSVTHEKNSLKFQIPRNVNIVSYNNNIELIEFVMKSFKTIFGISHVTYSQDKHGMVSMVINNTIIAHLFVKIFNCKFDGKRIPKFFNRFSYEHIQYFLAGLVSSDGCVSKTNNIAIQLTNPPLINDIFHLARSVNIPVTVTFMAGKENYKATGRLGVPPNIVNGIIKKHYDDLRLDTLDGDHQWNKVKIINGTTFMRLNIKEICSERPTYVYTLGVDDDHSYSINGIIAENCFLLAMADDSVTGIYKTLADCAMISKHAGGIGLHLHNIRARGSLIKGTNGTSNGIVPMLRVFNNTARYIDQGGGRRNGSFAMYLEPWHADIEDFLRMKQNTGAEEERARDLFYALWVPDLFMKRIEEDGLWSLFCPSEAPGLADVVGEEFEALYVKYEKEGRARKQIKAQKLWFEVLDAQIESGTPYLLYKDAANRKSNQKNLGIIKSSNLCTEVIQYSNPEETAVCNLASIGLPTFIKEELVTHADSVTYKEKSFDFEKLRKVVKIVTRNLNNVIDINYYPTVETKTSNMRHRPIGMGVQGLADVFAILKMSWESEEAKDLNKKIFEHMYFAAVEASMEIAKKDGHYSSFEGSPASKGILQFDMWGVKPSTDLDWDRLKKQVVKHGLRNSLLIAPMPTASTSQILGFNECFEPVTTNIYTRRTLAGEFVVINKYLLKELIDLGLWNEDIKQQIVNHNGSIQNISEIADVLKARYKTSWELSQKILIDMAADRGAFICQSQSLNLFIADPNYAKLTSMHFYGWKKGLKTGCYYLRTKAPVTAQKFTVDPRMIVETEEDRKKREKRELLNKLAADYEEEAKKAKDLADSGEGCLFCSS